MLLKTLVVIALIAAESYAMRGTPQTASPCPSGVLTATYLIGGPPGKSGDWEGVIDLNQFSNLPEINLLLTFSNDIRLFLNDAYGSIVNQDRSFLIRYKQRPPQNRVQFSVKAPSHSTPSPPIGVYLNGVDICNFSQQVVEEPSTTRAPRPPTRPPRPPVTYSTTRKPSQISTTTLRPYVPSTKPPFEIDIRVDVTDEQCGQRLVYHQGFITNGYPSKEGDWPWHSAIFHRSSSTGYDYKCGGSLISNKIVLTAAHCVIENGRPLIPDRIVVKLGLHNRLISSRNTEEFETYKVILHPDFDFNDLKSDIALLKLSTIVQFTNYIQPVCLWPNELIDISSVVGLEGIVIGWGLDENDNLADILSQAKMPVVDFQTCLASNRDFFGMFLSNENYCAGFRNGTSVCNGDSGGGMVFLSQGRYFIRGVVSLSVSLEDRDVCNPKQYVIFTDVAKYLTWIYKHT